LTLWTRNGTTTDRWEEVMRSMVQLILGTYMVWDARRLRLCDTYFDAQQPIAEAAREATPAGACPYFAGTENRPSVHQ
jgi:hypothetical protein